MNDTSWLLMSAVNAILVIGLAVVFVVIQLRGGFSAKNPSDDGGCKSKSTVVALVIGALTLLAAALTSLTLKGPG